MDIRGQPAGARLLQGARLGTRWRQAATSGHGRVDGELAEGAPLSLPEGRARHNTAAMPVTFAEKLARIPHYEPGTSLDEAQARAETADAIKLASNESPFPPHPAVVEAITAAAHGVNRYPDPAASMLRRRIAERFEGTVSVDELEQAVREKLLP